jgi:hypothetical protein
MRRWLPNTKVPIYTCELDDRAPSLVLYPLEEVAQYGDCAYLNNTVAFAIAYAMYQKVGAINLFGIDFSYKGNVHFAEAGKACCEFWLAKCIEKGIDLKIAPRSGLLDTNTPVNEKLYGYHRLNDPDILVLDDEGRYRKVKLSWYEKKMMDEQLKNITEVRTVLDGPPEATRY